MPELDLSRLTECLPGLDDVVAQWGSHVGLRWHGADSLNSPAVAYAGGQRIAEWVLSRPERLAIGGLPILRQSFRARHPFWQAQLDAEVGHG